MSLDGIHAVVREKLDRGDLPPQKCLITWFDPGSGQLCVECEHPRGGLMRFHQACFAAWDEAREDMAPA